MYYSIKISNEFDFKKIFFNFFFSTFFPPKMILDNTWLKNKQTHKGQIWFSSHALKHTIFALPEKERKKKTHTHRR